MTAKGLIILGSTGSIGTQTLDVIRALPGRLRVVGLAAGGGNLDLLEQQAREFHPRAVAVAEPAGAAELRRRLAGEPIEVLGGREGLLQIAAWDGADVVLGAMVGFAGLEPTLAAIRAGRDIALANKETLVAAGALMTQEARACGVRLLPVDSEHSAIFQCLQGAPAGGLKKIILTASGGPFRGWSRDRLVGVSVADALKHPRWVMGRKVTIDSATLMNKGLEIIEAHWLFDMPVENIEVMVHPQSVVHSMVEFHDGSVVAQLGPTDMRLPIQYALTYPDRPANPFPRLDLAAQGSLTFERPDVEAFPSLKYATQAVTIGGTMPAVVNAANEVAVETFLSGHLDFLGIPRVVEHVMARHTPVPAAALEAVLQADAWARAEATRHLGG